MSNQHVTTHSISQDDIANFYLKKKRSWPDGAEVHPVDWTTGLPIRTQFLKSVLKMSEYEIFQYWASQKLSSGSRPPLQLSTGINICQFVASVDGSIGYFFESSTDLQNCPNVRKIAQFQLP